MELELYRPLADGHHKLEIAYDRGNKRVPEAYNYAIHPGDKLVVMEDASTVLDDVMSSLQLPLGRRSQQSERPIVR